MEFKLETDKIMIEIVDGIKVDPGEVIRIRYEIKDATLQTSLNCEFDKFICFSLEDLESFDSIKGDLNSVLKWGLKKVEENIRSKILERLKNADKEKEKYVKSLSYLTSGILMKEEFIVCDEKNIDIEDNEKDVLKDEDIDNF